MMTHLKFLFLPFFFTGIAIIGCHGQSDRTSTTLKLVSSIPLPGVRGRIDHLVFDTSRQWVFIAALGNNSVEVVDLKNKKVIYSIRGLDEPQGLAFIPESQSLMVANGATGACDIFKIPSFEKLTSIKLSGDADNIRYDAAHKKIYVGYGSGGMAMINAVTFKLDNEIQLYAHPESFQIDHSGEKMYVNMPEPEEIEVIDLAKQKVSAQWEISEATANYPMALDETNHRLFIGCRHEPKLLVLDTQSGKTVASLQIDSDIDDIFYNSGSQLLYLSCGNGYVDVIKQQDPDHYVLEEKVSTASGARTSIFIPSLNQLMVASPASIGREAALLIYSIR